MFAQDILGEIDTTLNQLIRNAEALQDVDVTDLAENEIHAFQKTQTSLLHHLMNMDLILETKRKNLSTQHKRSTGYKIQEKRAYFEKLNRKMNDTIETYTKKNQLFLKRRKKQYLVYSEMN